MKILLIAPFYDQGTPGESWSTYKWVQGISSIHEVTVLTQHRKGWDSQTSPTQAQRVVDWRGSIFDRLRGRIAWEIQPSYITFYLKARRWIRREYSLGNQYDLVHQLSPLALRYPSPATGIVPEYIIGPLAGSLPTPLAMRANATEGTWYRHLRKLDHLRFRYDPLLRTTYQNARCLLAVAPYVSSLLGKCCPPRIEYMSETGVESIYTRVQEDRPVGVPLRLLFVGRIIRTKGILEAIEAVARATSSVSLTLDVVGNGDTLKQAQELVRSYNIDSVVRFHGRQSRTTVFNFYRQSDALLFPSYREPSGNVVLEALSYSLPVITCDQGGPGFAVNSQCGFTLPIDSRERYIEGLKECIIRLASKPDLLRYLSSGAADRAHKLALWPNKIDHLCDVYESLKLNRRLSMPNLEV